MKKLISGVHHIALKCNGYKQFAQCVDFYHEVLGMDVLRAWGEGDRAGAMIDTGNGILELFANAGREMPKGVWPHVALATDDVDGCVAAVKAAGYEVFIEPKDIVIGSQLPFPARIAFCKGAAGEEIEFFCEK